MRNHVGQMNGGLVDVRNRCIVCISVLVLGIVAVGCSETPVSNAPSTQESAPVFDSVADLGDLEVTVETSSGPGPDISDGQGSRVEYVQPVSGKIRLTVIAKATNSSETTLPIRVEHNFPTVTTAAGEYLVPVGGELAASNAPSGKFGVSGGGLGPGGVLETVQYFDVESGQTGFEFSWDFEELGIYETALP